MLLDENADDEDDEDDVDVEDVLRRHAAPELAGAATEAKAMRKRAAVRLGGVVGREGMTKVAIIATTEMIKMIRSSQKKFSGLLAMCGAMTAPSVSPAMRGISPPTAVARRRW